MFRHRKVRAAFTLVELLTVVAILVLLISMLLPVLGLAKELARRVQCASNLRTLGQGFWSFATARDGRGPGGGGYWNPTTDWRSSVSWANILATEQRLPTQRYGNVPGKGKLYCTSMQPYGSEPPGGARRAYAANGNAVSRAYGKTLDPASVQSLHSYTLEYYYLGAALYRFPRPEYQFLIMEGERGGDARTCSTSNAPTYGVPLNPVGSSVPPWTGPPTDASLSFRHVRPRDPRMYQTQVTANFLFVDCHVEVYNPMARIQLADRTSLN